MKIKRKQKWGLWHRGRKRWCKGAAGRAEFNTKREALESKIAFTNRRRGPLVNYFRLFVEARQIHAVKG